MKFLRAFWRLFTRLTCCLGRISLLLLWAVLLALFYVQTKIVSLDALTVPAVVERELQAQLATTGLHFDYDRARFDTAGHLLIENVRVSDPATPGPLLTARTVALDLEPWPLTVGVLNVQEIRVTDATVLVPAAASLTGRAAHLVAHLDCVLRPQGRTLALPQFTAHLGQLAVTIDGAVLLPRAKSGTGGGVLDFAALIPAYLRTLRSVQEASAQLDNLVQPRLAIRLQPSATAIADAVISLDAEAWPTATGATYAGNLFRCGALHVVTTVPLLSPTPFPLLVRAVIADPVGYDDYLGDRLDLTLHGEAQAGWRGVALSRAEATLGSVVWRDHAVATGPVSITCDLPALTTVSLSLSVADRPWAVSADLNLEKKSAVISFAGQLDNALVALASRVTAPYLPKINLQKIIQFQAPAQLAATVALRDGWKFSRVEGWLHAGTAHAEGVDVDAAETHFSYADDQLLCDEAFLRTGESAARGSYAMDTATLDFRFLLTGQLRPAAINGWFSDWWPNFWKTFSFPGPPPKADVDIVGRWGTPELTKLFIGADVPAAAIRGVAFEQVRVRICLRDRWNDFLELSVAQGERTLHGAFTIIDGLPNGHWQRLRFAGESDLDLDLVAPLFGDAGKTFVAPYRFATPPHLKISGQLDDETPTGWKHQQADIAIVSTGAFAFNGFPVQNLVAQVSVRDELVELPAIALDFADGHASGHARVWTPAGGAQRISFDGALTSASLGEAIHQLENFGVTRRGEPAPAASKFQQRLAAGKLNLTLAAEGPFASPLLLNGQGRVAVTGADFGSIQMFGLLSNLLSHTLLDFSSLTLDTLGGDFTLAGDKISSADLNLTGPRAALQARGDYRLDSQSLDFKVKIDPFGRTHTVVGNVISWITGPLSNALEVHLQGTIDQPNWIFVYGPVSLLRTLTGTTTKTPVAVPPPPSAPPPPVGKK